MRVIFFGDSLIKGTLGINFVQKIATALPNHQFINAGVNGDTSLNLYRRVYEDVIKHKPDGVFIMIGINDATSYVESGLRLYFRLFKSIRGGQISPIFFRENMRALLTKLVRAGIKTWVALPPVEYRPEQIRVLKEMNNYTGELCAEMNIPVLDIQKALTPAQVPARPPIGMRTHQIALLAIMGSKNRYEQLRAQGGFTYTFDGIHLTETGAQRFADLIVPFLHTDGL